MRILLIHQVFLEDDEGGGSRWNEMIKCWSKQGNEITVLAGMVHYATGKKKERYKNRWIFFEKKDENITIVRSHVSNSKNRFRNRLVGYITFVISSIYTGIFKTKGKFDIIVVTSPPLFVGISAYVLSLFKGIPFMFEVRDLWIESAIDLGIIKNKEIIRLSYLFESFIYRKAKLINVLTPAFREKLINEKNVPAKKVIMIPNAADFFLSDELLESFDRIAFRKEHGLDGKFVVIYVGAHGVANHLIQVIETAELLRDEFKVLFLLIGDGMQKPMLKEEVQKKI